MSIAAGTQFTPKKFQPELPLERLILQQKPSGDEVVPMDVLFVGGGPAGLSGAIELARLVKQDPSVGAVEIGVLEKAASLGSHNLSGAVMNPLGLRELFPDLKDSDLPIRRSVTQEAVHLLTETGSVRLPTPPTMVNHGYYVVSICELVRWLGSKAEELGVNILSSFPADSLLVDGSRVLGVRTTPAGLNRDGQPGGNFMPPTDISAQVTVLCEGTRGPLTQAYCRWQKIESQAPQIFALGVKELWSVKRAPENIIHTMGWPLPKNAFGGSWLYPMADNMVSLGLVVGLDYHQSNLDVHMMLQQMKQHPLFRSILEGGECAEWGAKTIPEGGFHALPQRFSGDGVLMAGDAVGFVNVPALKGIHYAMLSGIYAARSIFAALKAKSTNQAQLSSYDQMIKSSVIWSDLYKVRNMRQAFKSGFFVGGAKAALMTLTGGAFPGGAGHSLEDADEPKVYEKEAVNNKIGLSKVDAVYLSGNKTRDDIPSHLSAGKDLPAELADFYSHVCPAGVYERRGDQLIVNAPNCIDCKATDVLGPRWQPREGGSGPNYKMM